MQCPVCSTDQSGAPGASPECERCGTDLGLLHYLQDLPVRLAEEGVALGAHGRLLEAVDKLQAAAALGPAEPAIRRALFAALEAAGMDDLAWVHLDRLRREAPLPDPILEEAAARIHDRRRFRARVERMVKWFGG